MSSLEGLNEALNTLSSYEKELHSGSSPNPATINNVSKLIQEHPE